MDFLDPRKKRSRNLRLIIGYVLMAVAIGLGAVILVYGANGYGINTKTGEIVQNGLLFVDSHPGGAEIYLNGQDRGTTTSARLILPAGKYTLTLKKPGYLPWERKFSLEEHSIARYVYPFLVPVKPVETTLKVYSSLPPVITQSPDRKWLLVETASAAGKTPRFDVYDTSDLTQPNKVLALPEGLLSSPAGSSPEDSKLEAVEWSTDNVHLLVKHTFTAGSEFIIIDRESPEKSINVNKILNTDPSEAALFNKKTAQLYLYDKTAKTLRLADIQKQTSEVVLKDVLAYKPYGTDLISYVTDSKQPPGQVQARIWNKAKTYPLYSFPAGDHYLINMAQFHGRWYYVAGSSSGQLVEVFKDPIDSIKNPAVGKAVPMLALHEAGATKALFSDNARFIEAEAGQDFAVYDFETQSGYRYKLDVPLDSTLQWMDGHRLAGRSGGKMFVMDYDSTNQHLISPSAEAAGGYFSSDYNHLLVMQPVSGSSAVSLTYIDMRAGNDLPKNLR